VKNDKNARKKAVKQKLPAAAVSNTADNSHTVIRREERLNGGKLPAETHSHQLSTKKGEQPSS